MEFAFLNHKKSLNNMDRELKDTLISDLQEIVQFEKKKLILPILLVFVLTGSILYGLDVRDNQRLDEEILDTQPAMTELVTLNIKSDHYPNASGLKTEADRKEASNEIIERTNRESEILKGNFIPAMPAVFAIESRLIPLTPSKIVYGGVSNENSLVFSLKDGYVVSKEPFEVLSEIQYRQRKLEELNREVNESNVSYQKFQQEVEEINSKEYKDEELRDYLFSENSSMGEENQFKISGLPYSDLKEALRNDSLKEIQFYHFLPSLFATFIAYYLFSGLIITGLRDFKSDIEEFSKKDRFFRNNLLLSAIASTTIAFLGLVIWWSIIDSANFIVSLSQLAVSSIFWLILFTVTVNELRKFTKYAWIIAGVGLNLLIIPIHGLAGYEQEFLLNTLITGATPFYPFMLGVFSEYGRIHGEKFLRKMISNKRKH